jgi:hypothetical protein
MVSRAAPSDNRSERDPDEIMLKRMNPGIKLRHAENPWLRNMAAGPPSNEAIWGMERGVA